MSAESQNYDAAVISATAEGAELTVSVYTLFPYAFTSIEQ